MASSPFAINSNRQRYPPTLSLFDLCEWVLEADERQSTCGCFEDSVGKGLRGFLRHIVTDTLEYSVRMFA
jgi:hypothetical protein